MFFLRPTDDVELALDDDAPLRRLRQQGPTGVGTLGVKLFILSLSFIFAATILLYVILMLRQETPQRDVMPVVRNGLIVSTVVILASSITLWIAIKAIARDDREGLARWLAITLGLGVVFVISQSINWWQIIDAGLPLNADNRPAALFVILTLLHALHVFGGLVRLVPVTLAARRGVYSRPDHEPVTNVAFYWHFLDVVWVLMLIAIVVTKG